MRSAPGGLDRVGEAGHRHHVAAERVLAAQENADADHALTAHRRHLGRGAVLEYGHQRDRAHLHEVGSLQRLVGLAEYSATRQRYGFQVGSEARQDVCGNAASSRLLGVKFALPSSANAGCIILSPKGYPVPFLRRAWAALPFGHY